MLYGANGFTGKLIIKEALRLGLKPILSGRNREAIIGLAQQYQLPYRLADLSDAYQLNKILEDVPVVLHAAGPFRFTAQPMIEACLKSKTHYVDITGEIGVFQQAHQYDEAAKECGIMLLPGAGFDVVPTDCLALHLKNLLPDAHSLKLAFVTNGGGVSRGTAKSIVEKLGEPGAVRERGIIKAQPLGDKGKTIDFGPLQKFAISAPLGDVFTAYYSTGIPNIECYTGISKKAYYFLKFQKLFNPLLRTPAVRQFIRMQINKRPEGPNKEQRKKSKSYFWGEVQNKTGKTIQARMSSTGGYSFTAHSSVLIVQKILNQNFKPGFQTPASAYGENLVLEIPGTRR